MSSGPAFGGRSGGGYGHSAPQMRSSTHLHVGPSVGYFGYGPAPMVYGGVGGGSSLFTFLILGIFAYVLFNTFVARCAYTAFASCLEASVQLQPRVVCGRKVRAFWPLLEPSKAALCVASCHPAATSFMRSSV